MYSMVDKKKYLDFNKLKYILCVFAIYPIIFHSQNNAYYDKYEYRKKRHEINFGAGASSCLTDLGGRDAIGSGFLWDIDIAKTSYIGNFSYIYNALSKFSIRLNFFYS